MKYVGLVVVLAGLLVGGCNTVAGIGEDLKAGGSALGDASKK